MPAFAIQERRFVVVLAAMLSAAALNAQSPAFRNTDPSIGYVGSATCGTAGCHAEIERDYQPTAHGQSLAPANTAESLARAAKPATVFNPNNHRYYRVYQQGGELYQSVYEVGKNGRRTYEITHKLDYVAGGGIVGYSYLFRVGAWLFQAPLSYYTRARGWELSPGYALDDLGFTRVATTGCVMCHNGQPEPIAKRDGSYEELPFRFGELGIGCEACHGPGALHVKEMQARKGGLSGARELKSAAIDTSIVNPTRLSPQLAGDLCQECHQQGDTQVLLPGKTVLDYRPGVPLTETIAKLKIPLKPQQRAEANQLEVRPPVQGSLEQSIEWKNSALEMSLCYQATHGQLTCGTCHSIHHQAKPEDAKAAYRAACLTCHTVKSCTLGPEDPKRVTAADSCIECHMEKRAVAGVVHSSDTKHRIVRYPGQPLPDAAFEQPAADLPGLLWLNRPEGATDARLPDVVELEAYFTAARKDPSLWPFWFRKLKELSKSQPDDPAVLNALGAVALAEKKDSAAAAGYFAQALKEGSEEPTTFSDLAVALTNLGRGHEAQSVLERGVAAYPYDAALTARLAQQYAMDGQADEARKLVRRYRAVFPEDLTMQAVEQRVDAAEDIDPPMAARHLPPEAPR